MEELQEAREELAAVERELNMKSSQARERGGAELIRGDEVLKTHSYYPQHRNTAGSASGFTHKSFVLFRNITKSVVLKLQK